MMFLVFLNMVFPKMTRFDVASVQVFYRKDQMRFSSLRVNRFDEVQRL